MRALLPAFVLCLLWMDGSRESASAQDSDLDGLATLIEVIAERNAFKTASHACHFEQNGSGLAVTRVQGLRSAPTLEGPLICPDLGEAGEPAWRELMEKYAELDVRLNRRLKRGSFAPGELDRYVSLKHKVGWAFACNLARTGAGRKLALNSMYFVQKVGARIDRPDLVATSDRWMGLVKRIEKLHDQRGKGAPKRCLPLGVAESDDSDTDVHAEANLESEDPVEREPAREASNTSTESSSGAKSIQSRGYSGPIPDKIWRAMRGKSWHGDLKCPSRGQLALLHIPYRDFAGERKTGQMIVAKKVASDVLDVFAELYRVAFRIEKMVLVHKFGGDDDRSMAANNTSAYNCRTTTSGRSMSAHSFGRAIDINPVQNPYVRRGRAQPAAGHAYRKGRNRKRRGMIRNGDAVVKAFSKIGWKWGGYWRSVKDYQHFSQSGR